MYLNHTVYVSALTNLDVHIRLPQSEQCRIVRIDMKIGRGSLQYVMIGLAQGSVRVSSHPGLIGFGLREEEAALVRFASALVLIASECATVPLNGVDEVVQSAVSWIVWVGEFGRYVLLDECGQRAPAVDGGRVRRVLHPEQHVNVR